MSDPYPKPGSVAPGSSKDTASKTLAETQAGTQKADALTNAKNIEVDRPRPSKQANTYASEQYKLLLKNWTNIEQRLREQGKQEQISKYLRTILEVKTKTQRIISICSRDSKKMIDLLPKIPSTKIVGKPLQQLLDMDSSSESLDEPQVKLKALIGLTAREGFILQPLNSSILITGFIANSQRHLDNYTSKFISTDPKLRRPKLCMFGVDEKSPKALNIVEMIESDPQPVRYTKRILQTQKSAKEELSKIRDCFFVSENILAVSMSMKLQFVDLRNPEWEVMDPLEEIRINSNTPKEFALIHYTGGVVCMGLETTSLIINQYSFKDYKNFKEALVQGEAFTKTEFKQPNFFTKNPQTNSAWDQILHCQIVDLIAPNSEGIPTQTAGASVPQMLLIVKTSGEVFLKPLGGESSRFQFAGKHESVKIGESIAQPLAVFYCPASQQISFLCLEAITVPKKQMELTDQSKPKAETAASNHKIDDPQCLVLTSYKLSFQTGQSSKSTMIKLVESGQRTKFYFSRFTPLAKDGTNAQNTQPRYIAPKTDDPQRSAYFKSPKDIKFGVTYVSGKPHCLVVMNLDPQLKKGFISGFDAETQKGQYDLESDSDADVSAENPVGNVQNQRLNLAEFDLVYDMTPSNRVKDLEIKCTIQSILHKPASQPKSSEPQSAVQTAEANQTPTLEQHSGLHFVVSLKNNTIPLTHLLFKVVPRPNNPNNQANKPPDTKDFNSFTTLTALEKLKVENMKNVELLEFTLKRIDLMVEERIKKLKDQSDPKDKKGTKEQNEAETAPQPQADPPISLPGQHMSQSTFVNTASQGQVDFGMNSRAGPGSTALGDSTRYEHQEPRPPQMRMSDHFGVEPHIWPNQPRVGPPNIYQGQPSQPRVGLDESVNLTQSMAQSGVWARPYAAQASNGSLSSASRPISQSTNPFETSNPFLDPEDDDQT